MWVRRALAVCLLAALAAVGCGDSRSERLRDDWRRLCEGIVPGTTTLRQADALFQPVPLDRFPCDQAADPFIPVTQPDVCVYGPETRVCEWAWQVPTSDVCGPAGGCTFRCAVRVAGRAPTLDEDLDKPVCAREFLDEQPFIVKGAE